MSNDRIEAMVELAERLYKGFATVAGVVGGLGFYGLVFGSTYTAMDLIGIAAVAMICSVTASVWHAYQKSKG